jgi:hypothetical protein
MRGIAGLAVCFHLCVTRSSILRRQFVPRMMKWLIWRQNFNFARQISTSPDIGALNLGKVSPAK